MIVDGKDLILGRLATKVAKAALLGEQVQVVNSEHVMMTGTKKTIFAKYKRFRAMGEPFNGPFIPRLPDRFVRRSIKRMLPMEKSRGREVYKNIMCYLGVPEEFKGKEMVTFEEAKISKVPNLKYISVKEICKFMGGKYE